MEESIAAAYDANRPALYSYLASLTRDITTAEDLTQETFARLTIEIRAGRAPNNVRAWLFQVGRNLVFSNGRRQRTAERHRQLDHERRAPSAEDDVLRSEQRREIQALLSRLDPIDRRSLVMAALGYTSAEIGAAIGRSENAVRTRICRARLRLRLELERPSAA